MLNVGDVMDDVADLIKEVTGAVIEPRFDALREADVTYKSPGEVVTIADVEAEQALRRGLDIIDSDCVVVGEEAASADPDLLKRLADERAWVVDPLDGTGNFVAGSLDWAVMVARIERGDTVAAWVWQPATRTMWQAERGAGTVCNGVPVTRAPSTRPTSGLRGAVLTRFLDAATAERVEANRHKFAEVTPGSKCTGINYPRLIAGEADFMLYWRTLPWDHAPGVLLAQEAGAFIRRPDGASYRPDELATGLLVAADEAAWHQIREALLGT